MERNMKQIGARLKKARTAAGYTQEQAAAHLDLSQSYVASVEGGRYWPHLRVFLNFCDLYGVTADSILYGNLAIYQEQFDQEIKEILDGCTEKERAYLISLMGSGLEAYRKSNI